MHKTCVDIGTSTGTQRRRREETKRIRRGDAEETQRRRRGDAEETQDAEDTQRTRRGHAEDVQRTPGDANGDAEGGGDADRGDAEDMRTGAPCGDATDTQSRGRRVDAVGAEEAQGGRAK